MKLKIGKLIKKIGLALVSGLFIIVLGTVGIDAVDNRGNMKESIVSKLIFGGSDALCAEGMVFVQSSFGDFCIDQYEASASDDCPYPRPNSSNESKYNTDSPQCQTVSEKDRLPWTNILQNQAALACRKAGKRLASNREWSEAALGTPDLNEGWQIKDCHVSKNWPEQPGITGTGRECVSFAGAYDMAGNVWEWVDGSIEDGKYGDRELPKDGYISGFSPEDGFPTDTAEVADELYNNDYLWLKDTKTRTIARGGYWDNKTEAGQYAHYIVSTPSYAANATGFRCVSNPKN